MKTIKIFALPSHQTKERTSGVDFARIIQPMKYLNGYKDDDIALDVTMYDISNDSLSWVDIGKQFDLVFLNYTVMDWQYAAMGSCVHGQGKKIIMDVDDAMWYVQPDNVVHDQLKELNGAYKLTCMLNDVDGVTTTNRYLRNIICDKTYKYPDKVKVIPNQIDLSLYSSTYSAKNTNTITLLHYGSTSHFEDLLDDEFVKGIDKLFSDYPNVKIKTIGSFISKLKYKWGVRYEHDFGDVDIYKWVKEKFSLFMEEADIVVVPLRDNTYNRSKSDIKFLETASAMKPGVFSNVRPYADTIEHGKTGYLAHTADDWYNCLKELIDSREKRFEIGTNAYNYVKNERQIQNNLSLYIDFIKKIVL
jgi:glycosyltransferase involved in cell wall biosynthesis